MKHINKFIDTNLMDSEIKRLDKIRQELKRKNAILRTRINRLRKIVSDINQSDDNSDDF